MKAIQLITPGAPVELREVPLPAIGPGDVLVRVRAAGICHSDAHYRRGKPVGTRLPLTLGHEVAGVIEAAGSDVPPARVGERVCIHYVVSCGDCAQCLVGREQFCVSYQMIGNHRPGGWAEFIAVPARNAVTVPAGVEAHHAAVLMCAGATALHAINRSQLQAGERVAVFGAGGLGMCAIQIALARGAAEVFAVDIDKAKLAVARSFGASTVDAGRLHASHEIRARLDGRGVDVALEFIGRPETIAESVRALGIHGRAVVAGLAALPVEIDTYRDLLGNESSLLGANDHLRGELDELLALSADRRIHLGPIVVNQVPFEAAEVNDVLDQLDHFRAPIRSVISMAA
jgi:propanol-preferring alcohol dehydrogenase